ncbi:putative disease resistance protein RGA3 [Cocos nucifera]|uniref:Putative disease resistance protein RGA3 n=1 Tax=Cocos nucifera TaxID=13894 RepID=A0A8K0HSK1_COCNU|nr:putative disease resistance protein RGA3 [Cocos nucifera]
MLNIEDAKDVNLQSEHQLQRLKLIWSHGALNYEDDVDWDLKLHVCSEKNNSAPVDEEVEEALLECLQPHRVAHKGCLNSNTSETDDEVFTDDENLERQVMDCEMEDDDQNHDRGPLSDDLVRSPSQ